MPGETFTPSVTAISQAPATTITPYGELCEDTIGAFQDAVFDVTSRDERDIVVDLRDVTLFSAAAIRIVVQARARLHARGLDVRIVNAPPLAVTSLIAVGLDHLLVSD